MVGGGREVVGSMDGDGDGDGVEEVKAGRRALVEPIVQLEAIDHRPSSTKELQKD